MALTFYISSDLAMSDTAVLFRHTRAVAPLHLRSRDLSGVAVTANLHKPSPRIPLSHLSVATDVVAVRIDDISVLVGIRRWLHACDPVSGKYCTFKAELQYFNY